MRLNEFYKIFLIFFLKYKNLIEVHVIILHFSPATYFRQFSCSLTSNDGVSVGWFWMSTTSMQRLIEQLRKKWLNLFLKCFNWGKTIWIYHFVQCWSCCLGVELVLLIWRIKLVRKIKSQLYPNGFSWIISSVCENVIHSMYFLIDILCSMSRKWSEMLHFVK